MKSEAEIRQQIAYHRENLEGWREPNGKLGDAGGYLLPTEPDPDERRDVRRRLKAAIYTLEWVLGERSTMTTKLDEARHERAMGTPTGGDMPATIAATEEALSVVHSAIAAAQSSDDVDAAPMLMAQQSLLFDRYRRLEKHLEALKAEASNGGARG